MKFMWLLISHTMHFWLLFICNFRDLVLSYLGLMNQQRSSWRLQMWSMVMWRCYESTGALPNIMLYICKLIYYRTAADYKHDAHFPVIGHW